ncbi:TonB-dependent receptor [Caulobacter sp. S45]|uniref:TonB-dependent receptor n=1 Tax=Caulobacter sp. S45 TaxID=1641861 RepID=UPI0015752C0B|nr:TonB-dependent receptor [Caulobacter sp. S45]
MRRWALAGLSAAISAGTAAEARAQSAYNDARAAAPSQAGEVVVTAERRSTALEKTALAISLIPASDLDRSFIHDLAGLNAIVPSLEITHAAGFENLVSIRGVGSETPENALTTSPGVSLFVDGVYIANTISLDQTLFDVDRIEVLRGPQGALYGQSSIGGAISILTQQPKLRSFDAQGGATAGDYALFRERAEVNIPIGDTLALRLSAQAFDHDGFTQNLAIPQNRLDDAHDVSGKAAVLWKPNDRFSATLTGMVYHSDQNGAAQKNILELSTPGLEDPRVVDQDYPAHFDLLTQLYHLNLQWELAGVTVKSVTAYQSLDHVQQEDSSRSAFTRLGQYDDVAAWNTSLKNYTEEFDLLSRPDARLEWTAGAFILAQTSRQFIAEFEGKTAPTPASLTVASDIESAPPANLSYGNDTRLSRQSYSGFAQLTYHLTPRLRLTAGGRLNHDAYEQDSFNFSGFGSATVSHGYNDTVGTWRVQADYDLTPRSLVYASAARGYKPGGVNGDNGQLVVPDTFTPETNTAFELGSKSRFFGRSLQLNLAAFYYLYRDMQYIEYDPVPFQSGISNIPSVHTYGLEGEAAYVALGGRLHLDASLALENGRVQGDYRSIDSTVANGIEQTAACGYGYNPGCYPAVIAAARDLQGKTPPDMPKASGAISAAYTFDVPALGGQPAGALTPSVQYVYRGSEWARVFNEPGLDRVDPYGVTNLNLDYVPGTMGLKLSLTVTNAFDVDGVNSRYTDPYGTGQTSQQYIPPRQILGTVSYAFR